MRQITIYQHGLILISQILPVAEPSSFELKKLVIANGGIFHHYYAREKVTHIIASNLPNSKIANLTDKKVCRPDWIVER